MTAERKVQRAYEPQPTQRAWHACGAYASGFGGAKFGGKSLALLMELDWGEGSGRLRRTTWVTRR